MLYCNCISIQTTNLTSYYCSGNCKQLCCSEYIRVQHYLWARPWIQPNVEHDIWRILDVKMWHVPDIPHMTPGPGRSKKFLQVYFSNCGVSFRESSLFLSIEGTVPYNDINERLKFLRRDPFLFLNEENIHFSSSVPTLSFQTLFFTFINRLTWRKMNQNT